MKADNRKAEWIVALFLVLFFIIVAWISKNLEKALVTSVTLGVFAAVIQGKWKVGMTDACGSFFPCLRFFILL